MNHVTRDWNLSHLTEARQQFAREKLASGYWVFEREDGSVFAQDAHPRDVGAKSKRNVVCCYHPLPQAERLGLTA